MELNNTEGLGLLSPRSEMSFAVFMSEKKKNQKNNKELFSLTAV